MTEVATYGALCSGIGGLELAVEEVFGFHGLWHAEIDPDAAMVHHEHWPFVPNLGDLTAVDWSEVEPVELMCFGFPCQDLSHASKGAGITEGTRSGLWFDCLRAVRMVRPRLVVVENVSALLTRREGLDFSIVMAGLAEAGFDTEWISFRASDIGAPHRRERVFLVAADPGRLGSPGRREARHEGVGRWDERIKRGLGTEERGQDPTHADEQGSQGSEPAEGHVVPAWGDYEPAIRRWERITGRPAPSAVDGRGRLNPPFVEWMMGYPEGWVDGLKRTAALRCLGNSVVPLQAVAALSIVLEAWEVAA